MKNKSPKQELSPRSGMSFAALNTSTINEQWGYFLIFTVTFLVYILSPVITNTDSAYTYYVSASILQDGDIQLDEYAPLLDLKNDYRLMLVNGHIYSYYPSAIPVLVLPVTWAANQLFPLRYKTDFYTYLLTHKPDQRTGKLELLIASLISALCAVAIYKIGRQQNLSISQALLLVLIFAFASPMYSTSSRALWQHGPSVLALSLTILSLLLFKENPGQGKHLYIAAFFLAISYLIRPTNSLSVIFISLYVFFNHRKMIIQFLTTMAAILTLFMIHSYLTYGSLLPPYSFQLFNRFGSFTSFLNALAGLMVSPNRGLLIFSSVFLFSFYGIYLRIKENLFNTAALEPYLLCIFIAHWVLTATFEQWDGGWTLGPRYMADLTGYLAFMLIPVIPGIFPHAQKLFIRNIFFATIAISIAIQSYISFSPHPFYWTGKPEALTEAPDRVWDWSDLQFLRGTCKDDPREGKAPACWFEHR
jgi:hypothetical protein